MRSGRSHGIQQKKADEISSTPTGGGAEVLRHGSPGIVIATMIMLASVSCGGADEPSPTSSQNATPQGEGSTLTITATEFSFDLQGVEVVSAGTSEVTLVNEGTAFHQAEFVKLKEGVSFGEFRAELDEPVAFGGLLPGSAATLTEPGSDCKIATVSPDDSLTQPCDLVPGTYAVMCFVPGDSEGSHLAHWALGQVAPLEVQ